MEEWKPIKDYEGIYEVSSWGRVRSLPSTKMRKSASGNMYATKTKGKVLTPYMSASVGYFMVDLWKNGVKSKLLVHRLVAIAFVDGYAEGLLVNHKDECKTNNRADNLEWCNHAYNVQYSKKTFCRCTFRRK